MAACGAGPEQSRPPSSRARFGRSLSVLAQEVALPGREAGRLASHHEIAIALVPTVAQGGDEANHPKEKHRIEQDERRDDQHASPDHRFFLGPRCRVQGPFQHLVQFGIVNLSIRQDAILIAHQARRGRLRHARRSMSSTARASSLASGPGISRVKVSASVR